MPIPALKDDLFLPPRLSGGAATQPTSPRQGNGRRGCGRTGVIGEHEIAQDDRRGRREFERRVESQRRRALAAGLEPMRNGWRVGGEDFLDRLQAKWDGKAGEHHGARERRETEMERAHRLIASALACVGWRVERLATERKGDAVKVAIARRLREETTVPLKWIARELRMGTWTHLNRLLHVRK